jgi:hypothetical protein
MNLSQASKYTAQQNAGSVTPPAGFVNYLGITSSSAYSVLAADSFYLYQAIEGYNIADLGFGTTNAQTVTLSFWVRSSLTGSFGGTLAGYNGSTFRSYPFSYTISSANTWTQINITIPGDTTTFAYDKTNSFGFFVIFSLGVGTTNSGTANAWTGSLVLQPTGSVSVVGTNGATFYITGVQLEKGSTATSFDYRPYGTELALCQRYCLVKSQANGATTMGNGWWNGSTTAALLWMVFPVSMRSAPTASQNGGTWKQEGIASSFTATGTIQGSTFGTDGGWINWNAISGGTGTSAQPTGAEITSSLTMVLTLSSEL